MKYYIEAVAGETEKCIREPSPEQIELALDNLLPIKYHFVLCKADARVGDLKAGDCEFLQTIFDPDCEFSDKPFIVEAAVVRDENEKIYTPLMFRTKMDIDKLKKTFRMFVLGFNPDLSDWENVTDKVFCYPKKTSKMGR